ncbi:MULTISPECIES: hypothetical protein [Paenarthrobacter]|nr:hypothetical protein [Paenarthrobacter sp. PAE-2]MCW3767260.1 hypothetical protein [Paenarthrobacter sp. PAE-2]
MKEPSQAPRMLMPMSMLVTVTMTMTMAMFVRMNVVFPSGAGHR